MARQVDTAYGWGYYNGTRAFAERGQFRLASVTGLGGANPVRFFEVGATSTTKMTIAWNRQALTTGHATRERVSRESRPQDLFARSGLASQPVHIEHR